eukprot:TRINITY_DN5053_c2_g1_i1.p1 TRINITY_DN5053_c2_g1~~TRINITY_DN5053_c2_g1_i1.p1  ORF type:complete len:653 (-),score=114.71 TRINITY_DN5053_c2_g1_i1:131-1843(-)
MYYYSGSQLQLEWTNQHACGDNEEVDCDVVIQYMCQPESYGIRDGTPKSATDAAVTTIPFSANTSPNTNPNYGQHEDYYYYNDCNQRTRNLGLFTADQQMGGTTAIYTRQNNGGTRYGLECPEERDYYPYWHPTPWVDVAVLTKNTSRCAWYQKQSQNVQNKGVCVTTKNETTPYNNEIDCSQNGDVWKLVGAFNVPPPECLEAPWGRINHLGNTQGGYMPSYNWTIPNVNFSTCVVRIRYNVSTGGFPQQDGTGEPFVNSTFNNNNSPVKNRPYLKYDDSGRYLALAINTNQYFRTFQDRSYVFSIRPRPSNISADAMIYNLNVRGKRGDIVEVYPSVEYDFVPNNLVVNKSDFIHFQWTGSDYNPQTYPNDGEGGPGAPGATASGADRTNLVEIPTLNDNVPFNLTESQGRTMFVTKNGQPDIATIIRFAYLDQDVGNCSSMTALNLVTANQRDFYALNCFKLNMAPNGPYFDGGLVQMNQNGTFRYMCSRNNDFSNRDQKGKLTVVDPNQRQGSSGGIGAGWIAFICFIVLFAGAVAVAGFFVFRNTKKKDEQIRHYVSDLNETLIE